MNVKNNSKAVRFFFVLALFLYFSVRTAISSGEPQQNHLRIMFYNTENTFDTWNDSLTNDDEFLPESERRWTKSKYYDKLNAIYKVIAAIGEISPPEIVCLAEIENRKVLNDLIYSTPLEKYPYQIVHYNSPDQRGIDVAMLYRKDKVTVISSHKIRINFPDNPDSQTRDILHVKMLAGKSDTLHVFVNHWPSRRGGKKQSEGKRLYVASILKRTTDSILQVNPFSKIIITGDFNDEPNDLSLSRTLNAKIAGEDIKSNEFYNLSGILQRSCKCGTYRYKTTWNMLDQFIVSGALLTASTGINSCSKCVQIANFDFLLQDEDKYGGKKPYPTYRGPRYTGGFSDHLPIVLYLSY